MYEAHHDQGLEILGIAFVEGDEKGRKWLVDYMAKKGLTWTNAPTVQRWYGAPFEAYDVHFLPFNLVLDRAGRVFALNPELDEIESVVRAALDKS